MMSKPLYPMVEPTTYLELADELSSRIESASRRTAADRAYYAAFLTCRDRLALKNYFTPYYDSRDHDYVQRTLREPNVLGTYGNQENRLRRARNCTTYKTCDLNPGQTDVRSLDWMIRTAKEIIKRVDALPTRL